jgi:hypothetical protein
MNNKKILIGFTLFSAIVIFAIVYFSFNKPHKNFVKAPLDYTIQSTELFQKYQVDVSNANTNFLDKILLIKGTIKEISSNMIILDGNIVCSFNPPQTIDPKLKLTDKISIKGRCIGYDDLLEEVRIDNCSLMQN